MSVLFEPIGRVTHENGRCYIRLKEEVFAAAQGLEEFSHIQVVWWFNLYDSAETRTCCVIDKPYRSGPESIGVLATRGPVRPNPIAITACEILRLDRGKHSVEVAYIDAENDTTVLDIKPYHPSADRVRDAKVPGWCAHWPGCLEDSGDFDWSREFNIPE